MGLWQDSARDVLHTGTLAVYGEAVVYTPASTGVAEPITAVYDSPAVLVSDASGHETQAIQPQIDVRVADLSVAPRRDDTVTVRGQSYRVTAVAPDGSGWSVLTLVARSTP